MSLGHSFEIVVDAAQLGSEWAWASIYGDIAGRLVGYFRINEVHDPEAMAGDVFFDLAHQIGQFSGNEDHFQTLVFSLAHKRLIGEMTGKGRSVRTKLTDRVLDRLQTEAPAEAGFEPVGTLAGLSSLNPKQRDVITLRVVGDLTLEQVSDVLGIGMWNVRTIQRKAMARLRAIQTKDLVTA